MSTLTPVLDDDELRARFREGDRIAFAQIYDRYHRLVFSVARRGTRTSHDAEEIVQLTFLRAWQASRRYDVDRPLAPWLATIARNAIIDRHRRVGTIQEVDLQDAPEGSSQDGTDELDLVWQVRSALAELRPEHREVLRLTHFEGLDQAAIAARLGVAVGTVKSRVYRASAALRAVMANEEAQSSYTADAIGAR